MISTQTAKQIAKEISSIEASGNPMSIVVSLEVGTNEAKWGEAMALPEDEMQAALESAGLDPDSISDMMTAEDFINYYEDCLN